MVVAEEGENEVQVRLRAEYAYTVKLLVEDRDGGDITLVDATWDSPPHACVPGRAIPMVENRGEQRIGSLPLEVFVNARGFRPVRLSVYGQDEWAAGEREYRVVLRKLRTGVSERQFSPDAPILFAVNEASIRPDSHAALDAMALRIASLDASVQVDVEAHTDSDGSDQYNEDLSVRRAEAVVAYLVDAGVSPDVLNPRGYGEYEPIVSNSTEEGRQENRRVVFTVLTPTL